MSHFLTLVIGDEPEKQLAKYDENLELPMHLYMTKEQLISGKRKEIEEYKKNYYDVFLQDKDAYLANCSKAHADYIENEFPKHLNWTDEQIPQTIRLPGSSAEAFTRLLSKLRNSD